MTEPVPREPIAPPRDTEPRDVDFDTSELFAGRTEIRIGHADAVYRLRITRAGKLILNK